MGDHHQGLPDYHLMLAAPPLRQGVVNWRGGSLTVETNKVWVDTTPDRVRKHKLVTEEIAANIPAMGELSEGEDVDFGSVVPAVKLFSPILGWDWYVIEWDAETGVCFGLVHGLSQDFGTFDLDDLASQTMGGIPVVEREVGWPGQTIRELQEMWHGHYPAEKPCY